jgi:hypothetical protein
MHVIVSSPMILKKTLSTKHNRMVFRILASISSYSSSDIPTNIFLLSSNALCSPCCTKKYHTLIFHGLKLFFQLNFSTSNLAFIIFTILQRLLLRYSQIYPHLFEKNSIGILLSILQLTSIDSLHVGISYPFSMCMRTFFLNALIPFDEKLPHRFLHLYFLTDI